MTTSSQLGVSAAGAAPVADVLGAAPPDGGGEKPAGAPTPPYVQRRGSRGRRLLDLLGLAPFLLYCTLFLLVPAASVVTGAFTSNEGRFTLVNVSESVQGVYRTSFLTSIRLSLVTAVVGAVLGLLLAYAVVNSPRSTLLRHLVSSAAGVFAQLGGVPLAFMFIATVGSIGIVTRALSGLGWDIYGGGFSLFSFTGIALVYVYFQVPLMVIVITPALDGLRPQWGEAAASLGATRWQYWRHVGGPLLLPAFLGALLLLFANAFAAYATAVALTSGVIPLVPVQIGSLLSGNVLASQENLGKALGLGMILLVALVMGLYAWLQRRTSRWLR